MSNPSELLDIQQMISNFIYHVDRSVEKFKKFIEHKYETTPMGSGKISILQQLLNLDNISNNNLNRLKKFTMDNTVNGSLKVVNNVERRELQSLIIKTSTSLDLISNIIGENNIMIANLVDNTLDKIDSMTLLSAS